MEVYYKDLISKETSLEKLVDDLAVAVRGADHLAEAVAGHLPARQRQQFKSRLEQFKHSCERLKSQAVVGARAADKTLRQYPYSSIGFAFSLGLLAGTLLKRNS